MSNINDKAERGSVISTILEVLKSGDKYGYEIIKEVEQKTGVLLKQPSLYSCLTRLENQGVITSYWTDSDIGGRRHYYKLVSNEEPVINETPIAETVHEQSESEEIIKETPGLTENFEVIHNAISINNVKPAVSTIPSSENNVDEEFNFDNMQFISNSIKLNNKKEAVSSLVEQAYINQKPNYDNNPAPVSTNSCEHINNILQLKTDSNNATINSLKEEIINSIQETEGVPQQISMIETSQEENINKYENILGDMLYEKKPAKEKQTESTQQFFNFDNEEIKVENDKNYLNNVLLKPANSNHEEVQPKKRKQISHFTNMDDLKKHLNQEGVILTEYSYLNYECTNSNRYTSTSAIFIFSIFKLLLMAVLTVLAFQCRKFSIQIVSSLVATSCLSLCETVILYFIQSNKYKTYLRINMLLMFVAIIAEFLISILIAFNSNISMIIKSFNISYIALLCPILINLLFLFFTKKASKF